MPQQPRLLRTSITTVQIFRIANLVIGCFSLSVLIATLPGVEFVQPMLVRKYGAAADVDAIIIFMRATLLLGLPLAYAAERLLRALRAILRTVEHGDPFVRANAARLRIIGWALLTLQLADLALGGARLIANALRIDYLQWQPSFTGWLAVMIAFVLAQVFERGAAMRDDLDGTI
ncbi:DUF2975 domain-containing protein [Sphingomonas sp. XXL09]|uniref:DUF2975 domain-containing protein n=1 Tax=Sphingomonas sp. XXL09 TaxID=3457787 RepID=UPI00406BA259